MNAKLAALLEKLFPRLALRGVKQVDTILSQFDKIAAELDRAVQRIDADINAKRVALQKKRQALADLEDKHYREVNALDESAMRALRTKNRLVDMTR